MTSDPLPPVFPRVSGPSDDATRPPETSTGSIFSKPTPTQPVAQTDGPGTPATATGSTRSRWLIALLATIAVVAVIGGVFLSLGPRAGAPSVAARYAPADTTMFVEAQLDLPGDQQDNLAEFMSHFPGFADPAAFDQKMDEMLEQAFTGVGGDLNWATDVEPWFGGLVACFGAKQSDAQESEGDFTIALSVNDRAALDQVLATKLTDAQSEDYQGHQLVDFHSGVMDRIVLAATDEVLLIGSDADQIKAALDAHDDRAPGLADDQFYLQQLGQLSANRLGSFYYDGVSAGMPLPEQAMEGMPDIGALQPLIAASSARVVGELRAEGDHLEIVARSERSSDADLPPLPGNATTNLSEKAPSDAMLYLEMRDVGTTIGFLLDTAMTPLAEPGHGSQCHGSAAVRAAAWNAARRVLRLHR